MFEYVKFPVLPIVRNHMIINTIITALAVLIVGLRLMARYLSGAKLWWDDYLILLSVPQGIGMLIIQGMWMDMGIGFPITETMPNILIILKMLLSYEVIYTVSIATIKLSVLIFYLRVFVNNGLRLATKLAIAFVTVWSVGNLLQCFLICRPFPKIYTPTIEGTCGDQIASFIAIGVFNIITDVIILTLPIPTVWSLKMSTTAKLGLTGVFLIGLIVSVVAVIRIVTLTQLDLMNLTGTMIWADFWSTTEPNLAIICVSLPMLGTLVSRIKIRARGLTSSGFGYASKSGAGVGGTGGAGYNTSGSGFSKLKGSAAGNSDIGLESLYAPNVKIHYQSAIAAERSSDVPELPHPTETGRGHSSDGSEIELAKRDSSKERGPGLGDRSGIQVQTKWTITSDRVTSPSPTPPA